MRDKLIRMIRLKQAFETVDEQGVIVILFGCDVPLELVNVAVVNAAWDTA